METHISITPTEILVWTNQPAHIIVLQKSPLARFVGEGSWELDKKALRRFPMLFTSLGRGMAKRVPANPFPKKHPGKVDLYKLAGLQ